MRIELAAAIRRIPVREEGIGVGDSPYLYLQLAISQIRELHDRK
jgi:hypothetical protein